MRRGVGLGMSCLWLVGRHGIHPFSNQRRIAYLSPPTQRGTHKIEDMKVPLLYFDLLTHSYSYFSFFTALGSHLWVDNINILFRHNLASRFFFLFFLLFFTLRHPSCHSPLSFSPSLYSSITTPSPLFSLPRSSLTTRSSPLEPLLLTLLQQTPTTYIQHNGC